MGITYDANGNETLNQLPVADVVRTVRTTIARDCGPGASEHEQDWVTKQLLRLMGIKKRDYVPAARRHDRRLQAQRAKMRAAAVAAVATTTQGKK